MANDFTGINDYSNMNDPIIKEYDYEENASYTKTFKHKNPTFTVDFSMSYNKTSHQVTLTAFLGKQLTFNSWALFDYSIGMLLYDKNATKRGSVYRDTPFGSGTHYSSPVNGSSTNNTKTITFNLNNSNYKTTDSSGDNDYIFYVEFCCYGCAAERGNSNYSFTSGKGAFKFIFTEDTGNGTIKNLKCSNKTTKTLTFSWTGVNEGLGSDDYVFNAIFYKYDPDAGDNWEEKSSVFLKLKDGTMSKTYTNLSPNTKYKLVLDFWMEDEDGATVPGSEKTLRKTATTLKPMKGDIDIRASATKYYISLDIDTRGSSKVSGHIYHWNGSSWSNIKSISNITSDQEIECVSGPYSPGETHKFYYDLSDTEGNTTSCSSISSTLKKINISQIKLSSNAVYYILQCASQNAYGKNVSDGVSIKSRLISGYSIDIDNISSRGSFTISDVLSYLSNNPLGALSYTNTVSSYMCNHNINYINLNRREEDYYIYAIIIDTNNESVLVNNASNDSLIRIGPIKLDSMGIDNIDQSQINKYTHSISISNIKVNLSHNSTYISYCYPSYSTSTSSYLISNEYGASNNLSGILQDPLTRERYIFTTLDIDDSSENIINPIPISSTSDLLSKYGTSSISGIYHRTMSIKDTSNEYYSNNNVIEGICGYTKENLKYVNGNLTVNILSTKLPYPYCLYDIYIGVRDNGGNSATKVVRSNTLFPYTKIYTNGGWHDAIPHIYSGGKWKKAIGKVYNNSDWQEQGSGNQAE